MTGSGDEPAGGDHQSDELSSAASPYEFSATEESYRPETDDSVFAEPWMKAVLHSPDSTDPGPSLPMTGQVSEDHSVWDEPGLIRETPTDALTWYRWYTDRAAAASGLQTWLASLAVVLVGGVLAVFGTFATQFVQGSALFGATLFGVTVVGPTTEEIMKIALPLWLVEKRPWYYRHYVQILVSACASGLAFAAVENVFYLNLYVTEPSPRLAAWRWTVCVLLHSGCSTIAGVGACRIWREFQRNRRVPALADGAPWIAAAIVIHGVYNGSVILMDVDGLEF